MHVVNMKDNFLAPYKLIENVPMVDGYTTPVTNIRALGNIAYNVIWASNTGGTGNIIVQGSIFDDKSGVAQWFDLDMDPVAVSGSSGCVGIDITTGIERIRLKYEATAPSTGGLFTVYVMAKGGC